MAKIMIVLLHAFASLALLPHALAIFNAALTLNVTSPPLNSIFFVGQTIPIVYDIFTVPGVNLTSFAIFLTQQLTFVNYTIDLTPPVAMDNKTATFINDTGAYEYTLNYTIPTLPLLDFGFYTIEFHCIDHYNTIKAPNGTTIQNATTVSDEFYIGLTIPPNITTSNISTVVSPSPTMSSFASFSQTPSSLPQASAPTAAAPGFRVEGLVVVAVLLVTLRLLA